MKRFWKKLKQFVLFTLIFSDILNGAMKELTKLDKKKQEIKEHGKDNPHLINDTDTRLRSIERQRDSVKFNLAEGILRAKGYKY